MVALPVADFEESEGGAWMHALIEDRVLFVWSGAWMHAPGVTILLDKSCAVALGWCMDARLRHHDKWNLRHSSWLIMLSARSTMITFAITRFVLLQASCTQEELIPKGRRCFGGAFSTPVLLQLLAATCKLPNCSYLSSHRCDDIFFIGVGITPMIFQAGAGI